MPGNTRKRRRKRKGTQAGRPDTRARRGPRPRSRQEAMAQARSNRAKAGSNRKAAPVDRRLIAPTWRGAAIRGGFFALLLFPISLLFGQELPAAVILTVIAAAFYIPLGFYTDTFFYNRRMKKIAAERAAAGSQRR